MKHAILISQNFAPVNASGTVRAFYFAKYLSEFGWYPHVIARHPFEEASQDAGLLKELEGRCDIHYVWQSSNHPIHGFLSRQKNKTCNNNRLSRAIYKTAFAIWLKAACLITLILFCVKAFQLSRKHQVDLVWATGDPWLSFDIGRWIKKLLSVPFIMDQRDPWTYGALWNPPSKSFAKRQVRREKRALKAADAVVYTSPLTKEIMQKRTMTELASKMSFICNGFDISTITDHSPDSQAGQHQILTLRYIGSLKGHRTPEPLVKAIKSLRKAGKIGEELKFEVVGPVGPWENYLRNPDNEEFIKLRGSVPYDESLQLMRSADVLVLLQTLTEGADVISGKVYEYLASGRPILAIVPQDGGDAWALNYADTGFIADFQSPDMIQKQLEILYNKWQNSDFYRLTPAPPEQFDRRKLTAELADLLNSCTKHKALQ